MMKRFALAFAAVKTKLTSPASALRQVSLVAGGTVVAQLLNVATLPLLSRIYSPADFGVMAVYASVVAILTEIAGLRYHLAIPLPKQTRYAQALACLSFIIQITMVSLISVVLFLAGDAILKKLSFDELVKYKYLLPVGLLTIGSYNIASQWAIRESLFTALGKTKVSQAASGSAAKIILGYLGLRPLGLLIGTIIGQAGGAGTLISAIIKKRRIATTKSEIKRAMIRYRKFPMYDTWTGMMNTFGISLPQLVLSSLYNVKFAGLYLMASSLLSVPATFVGNAIGQVFLQKASAAKYSGELPSISFKTYILLLQVGFFPIIALSIIAPPSLTIILGTQWMDSGYYALALSPWVAYIFSVSHLGNVFNILAMQKQAFVFEIIYIITRITAFYVGKIFFNSPLISVALYAIFNCVYLLFKMLYMFNKLKISSIRVLVDTLKVIVEALVLCLAVWLALHFAALPVFVLSFIISSLIYTLRTYKRAREFRVI